VLLRRERLFEAFDRDCGPGYLPVRVPLAAAFAFAAAAFGLTAPVAFGAASRLLGAWAAGASDLEEALAGSVSGEASGSATPIVLESTR
jgi:hypothetical protein